MSIVRLLASALTLGAAGWLEVFINTAATIGSAKTAGAQFAASDRTSLSAAVHGYVWQQVGLTGLILVAILLGIWWRPIRRALASIIAICAVGLAAYAISPDEAYAYYAQHDYAEPYTIMPNESAFWVPDVGDNRSGQDAFDSASYLDKNKIAAKDSSYRIRRCAAPVGASGATTMFRLAASSSSTASRSLANGSRLPQRARARTTRASTASRRRGTTSPWAWRSRPR